MHLQIHVQSTVTSGEVAECDNYRYSPGFVFDQMDIGQCEWTWAYSSCIVSVRGCTRTEENVGVAVPRRS